MNELRLNRIAVCDQHMVVRYALKSIINKTNSSIVIAEASDHDSTLKVLDTNDIDLIFLDIRQPGVSGMETIHQVRSKYPNIKIIVFSIYEENAYIEKAILLGAKAYLVKDASIEEILASIDAVIAGSLYLQNKNYHLKKDLEKKLINNRSDCALPHPLDKLSKREREVFFMLSEGQANRNIAKKMFLSPRTIETHRARILKKLSLNSTADLIRFAIKNNLLSL